MKREYIDLSEITTRSLYDEVKTYYEVVLKKATESGALKEPDANNEYTCELGRIGNLLYGYESTYMQTKQLNFKSPLVISIERELDKRHLKQRQAAELLDVKESTFSQIMTGRRPVSMRMAKKLYKIFQIDPHIILEYS